MKKQQPKNKSLINFIYLAMFLFILSWISLWGNSSFYQRWRLEQKARKAETEVGSVSAQNDSLRQENHKLKTDPDEQRRYARARYGHYEANETIYIFKPAQVDSLAKPK